jgi:hypothetical protein
VQLGQGVFTSVSNFSAHKIPKIDPHMHINVWVEAYFIPCWYAAADFPPTLNNNYDIISLAQTQKLLSMLHHDESDSDHMKISAGQPSKHG